MKHLKIEINYDFCTLDELSADERELVERAIDATKHSYSPYSHFSVGAALRLEDGSIMIGANQENAAYPSGLCAERAALFAAQSQHPELPVTLLAIAAGNEKGMTVDPVTPCGACRQVMLEVAHRYGRSFGVLLYGVRGVYRFHSADDLVPFSFVEGSLHS